MKEISAGGVVYRLDENSVKIQLIRDRYGHITLPKGKIEQGETIEEAALREIEEETGVLGRIKIPLKKIKYEYRAPGRGQIDKEVHYFLVEAHGGELRPQLEEINEVAWYEVETAWELQQQSGYNNNDSVVKKAIDLLQRQLLARAIDHTLLSPTADFEQIEQLCQEAMQHQFYSVCVNSVWVETCREFLQDTGVKISAVCGFPLGADASHLKAQEAAYCVSKGASEIDMVIQIGQLLAGEKKSVYEDIQQVVQAAKQVRRDALVKVILETGYLNEAQLQIGCRLAEEAGADFVKTSTGFGPRGASETDIVLMKKFVSGRMQIKASGGIRDADTAANMIKLGASRIGTSAGAAMMQRR